MKLEKSRYFKIEELVHPKILEVLCEEACWRLIPYSVVCGLDNLRRMYGGPIIINNVKNGLLNCGIRPKTTSVGAPRSDHKLYNYNLTAFDLHCSDLDKLTNIITSHNKLLGITRMENPACTIGWRHCTFSDNLMIGDLEIFNP